MAVTDCCECGKPLFSENLNCKFPGNHKGNRGQEKITPRCKYCRAGNSVGKDGWHVTEYQGGYPFSSVFCDELLARAKDDMSKQPGN